MGRIFNIGILTPNEYGNYYGVLIQSLAQRAHQVGARVFVIQTTWNRDITKPSEYNEKIGWNRFDAWIVLPNAIGIQYLNSLCSLGLPVVLISDDMGHPKSKVVMPDNYGGMKQAVNHLIEHGHKEIAFVGCFILNDQIERMQGYLDAMSEAGLESSVQNVFGTIDAMVSGGEKIAREILETKRPFTAIAVSCDFNAMGIIDVLRQESIRVPQDIAVVSFDNMETGRNFQVPLSTVNVELSQLAFKAMDVVVAQIVEPSADERVYVMPTQLVLRQSCGCAHREDSTAELHSRIDQLENAFRSLGKMLFEVFGVTSKLLSSKDQNVQNLDWMPSSVRWASLGLYANPASDRVLTVEEAVEFLHSDPELKNDLTDLRIRGSQRVVRRSIHRNYQQVDFPPLDILPDLAAASPNDLVWIQPIRTQGQVCGIISMIAPYNEGLLHFNLDLWQRVLDQFTLALEIENLNDDLVEKIEELHLSSQALERANRELAEMSLTDGLSGLPNRRFFDRTIDKELKTAYRRNEPLGVLMIDIDHFKRYNDVYGHLRGDECIQKVADTIRKSIYRSADFVARYGGEEFVVLLPNTDEESIDAVAQRIRKNVESEKLDHAGSDVGPHVTISVGASIVDFQDKDTSSSILSRADLALYKAKELGRNCVVKGFKIDTKNP